MRSLAQKILSGFLFLLVICFTQNANAQCGYDIDLSSDNLTVQGSIFKVIDYGPNFPQDVSWYIDGTNYVFSTDADFEFLAPAYGVCSICVDYEVAFQSGEDCIETICKNVYVVDPDEPCNAYFEFGTYDGPLPVVGGVNFNSITAGVNTEYSWDFGDGTFDLQSSGTVTHFYQASGSYEVKLSVWDAAQYCAVEFSQTVEVIIPDDPCEVLDCVWPGDTDGDSKATLADMVNVGVGFGMTGPPRENPSDFWDAQLATDWDMETLSGVNYKHFDCNGDGTIDISDIPAIQTNFTMMEGGVTNGQSALGGVPISLSFDVDTVFITEENQYLEINAGLNFGSNGIPMDDVYGVVLYLTYPKNYVLETEPVEFNYNENSFFGDMTEVLPLARNIQQEGQTDMVITRRSGFNISGQGRVATVKFIIDGDIIDGRAENEGETFAVDINVVAAVDIDGNEIPINLSAEPSGVFFQNSISTTAVEELIDASQIQVYPNPVSDLLKVEITDINLHPETVEVFDLLGQQVIFKQMDNHQLDIDVSKLSQGIYILKVKTEEGIGSKRIIVEE